ncbi:hypothetical protein FSP39_024375 [Pinctada imbricata]|uniref:Mab-21-like HhH/H2TH-like domain-containing protein n=1 Tax=Pinctada imbricata TaxID=66713 RepID=A0AA88XK49_PINIB|nr:hypothetical protein FSP39_024375 [Pinctada imbricata]
MAESSIKDEIYLISKGLYRLVSDIVGPECIVKMRRQKYKHFDFVQNCDNLPVFVITSGSMSEGFQFKSSDVDRMCVDRNAFVLTRLNHLHVKSLKTGSLFCMDNDECPPGFTLLRCLTSDRNNEEVFKCLAWRGDNIFLSSKMIREIILSSSETETHGPCQSENIMGIEVDTAFSLRSHMWPVQASCFITRSLDRRWPTYNVLKDICNDGCSFVPINSKQQTRSDVIDLEWRMSFSFAEKILIHSMNHCQFLCYGLTKLFLNEVLKQCSPPVNDLMCSYFMKTAVFWEISNNAEDWSIETFLPKFWNVFRRLIQWVRNGYCPNFFIPENNMFYGKICGENQRLLLSVLHDLYKDGYWCLLRCSSLNRKFENIITQPDIADMLSYNEEEYVSASAIEREKLRLIFPFEHTCPIHDRDGMITILDNTMRLNTDSDTMEYVVRLRLNNIFQQYTESLLMFTEPRRRNRKQYLTRKAAQALLIKAKTYFCVNFLHYSRCIYETGNYRKTIDILHFIKHRLQSQPYMYNWCLDDDIIMATKQQGMSYHTLIESFIVGDVTMNYLTSIDELLLECRAVGKHTGPSNLDIPPLVFINFLLILSYTRIENFQRLNDILDELQTLLHQNDNHHIFFTHKAISWEILGICQQIWGDRQSAFQSFINALNDKYNNFKEATIARINNLYN